MAARISLPNIRLKIFGNSNAIGKITLCPDDWHTKVFLLSKMHMNDRLGLVKTTNRDRCLAEINSYQI